MIQKLLTGGLGWILISLSSQGCQSGGTSTQEEGADDLDVTSCDDVSKISEAEIKKREGFGYVEESPMPDKQCHNCQLYLPPKEGQACGGCALFKGPVFEEGYCTYWAPLTDS